MNTPFSYYSFRAAQPDEVDLIWPIFQDAIEKRRLEGSDQWQDGYPNPAVIQRDIAKKDGYVAIDHTGRIVGYIALIFDGEPAYDLIEGNWLTHRPFSVIHRLAVSQHPRVKGLATWMLAEAERISLEMGYLSLKADTNFDNTGMLRVFEKRGYAYCGIVYFRGAGRRAFEKKLD